MSFHLSIIASGHTSTPAATAYFNGRVAEPKSIAGPQPTGATPQDQKLPQSADPITVTSAADFTLGRS